MTRASVRLTLARALAALANRMAPRHAVPAETRPDATRGTSAAASTSGRPPRAGASALLAPPFDQDQARRYRQALSDHKDRAAFVDFVIAELLGPSHTSCFWGDRLLTLDKSAGFLDDPAFAAAFARMRGAHEYDQYASPHTIAWRLHTLVWAARVALALPEGDFVECGVFKGDMAWVVNEVSALAASGRQFHLYDSFEGFDPAQTSDRDFPELPNFFAFANAVYSAAGLWDGVQARFAAMPHIHLHKGFLPGTLDHEGAPARIAYLHIDLNVASVEIACLERLFDRVVPGGVVIFDDYGWKPFRLQKEAEDTFFAARGYAVLELPTGQGLVLKR